MQRPCHQKQALFWVPHDTAVCLPMCVSNDYAQQAMSYRMQVLRSWARCSSSGYGHMGTPEVAQGRGTRAASLVCMNLSIAKHFLRAQSRADLVAVANAAKLAPEGRYVATDDGEIVWNHAASDTGYDGCEWMSDMLSYADPFQPQYTNVGVGLLDRLI
jgi:hypothetical protein